MPELTRSRVQGLIRDGHVKKNGRPVKNAALKVRHGENYTVTVPPAEPSGITPQPLPLDIVFEDQHLLILNKPAGLVVHPGAGHAESTLVNALMAHCGDSLSGIGGVARPGIVHRIDKDTSGLLAVAKHDRAHLGLGRLFADHDIDRKYVAIVAGGLRPGVGTVHTLIGRSRSNRTRMAVVPDDDPSPDAREAITHYRALTRFGIGRARLEGEAIATLVECTLETGRTHQIRVHMAHRNAPLIGDPVYGRGAGLAGLRPGDPAADHCLAVLHAFRRQALHAQRLGFVHPITEEPLCFERPPPADMQALIESLAAL